MSRKNKPLLRPSEPKSQRKQWLYIALLILLGFAVYANALPGKFVFDDEQLVFHNFYLKGWQYAGDVFTKSINQGAGRLSSFYRPMQIVTYAIDHSLWNLNVAGYHLTNIFWHLATAVLIFWFLRALSIDALVSFWTSLLFAVHPVHTEAVTYISGRADSLSAAFLFLTLILYLGLLKRYRITYFLAMLAAYSAALLSKENALILPFLILLIHNSFRHKIRWPFFGPLLSLAGIYVLLRLTALRSLLDTTPSDTTLFARIPGFFSALMTYTRILLFPFNLHMEYGTKILPFKDPQVIAGIILLSSSLTLAFRLKKTFPIASFAIFWFYLALLPSSNLYPINAYLAEHWLYLPSIGFFLLLAIGLQALYKKHSTRKIALSLVALLVLFFSILTIRQNTTWLDPQAFYERTLKFAPNSSACYTNLGRIYEKTGRRQDAIEAFKKAIAIDPMRSNSYSNLAVIYGGMGRRDEVIPLFEKAVQLSPEDAKLRSNLGAAYSEAGRLQDAIQSLNKALEMDPNLAGTAYNLAIIYERLGQKEKAAELLKKVQDINPEFKAERVLERAP